MIDSNQFAAGPEEYRPVIMWFWNDKIEESEIYRQIDGFHAQRINKFFIHPLSGFEETYLSDRFFDLIETAVKYAAERGMKFWIYDEYNWPSGLAGDRLLRDYPEYRMVVVRHRTMVLGEGQRGSVGFPGRFLSAQAVYGNVSVDITGEGTIDEEKGTFAWRNKETGNCAVIVFSEEKQRGVCPSAQMSPNHDNEEGYLDALNPEAVRKFLDLTHERYAGRLGAYFGHTIEGLFTDEPALASPFDIGPDTIPWTKAFEDVFREANGYDLLPKMCELVMGTGDFRRTRHDYWRTLIDRFSGAYAGQMSEWCEKHRLLLTGHCCGDDNLIADLLQSGSAFSTLQHFSIPGADSIFSKQFIDRENFNIAGKMAASVAEHSGAPRALCETYTGSGWDVSMEEMKRVFNRLAVLGINMIQFMGAYYSLRDLRKRNPTSYPPSHSFQSPLWPYYGEFSDYISRICYANTLGTHAADTALLAPTTTVWTEYEQRHDFAECSGDGDDKPFGDLNYTELTFYGIHNALMQLQEDFDLLHEPSFLEAEVVDGELRYRGHAFRQLIIPSAISLSAAVWAKLQAYIASGGRVCFINMLPQYSSELGDISAALEALTGFQPEAAAKATRAVFKLPGRPSTQVTVYGAFAHIVTNEWKLRGNEGFRVALQQAFAWKKPYLQLSEPSVHVQLTHRKSQDRHLFLLINDGTAPYRGEALLEGRGEATWFDPTTGESAACASVYDAASDRSAVRLPLEGLAAVILEWKPGSASFAVPETTDPACETVPLDGEWRFRTAEGINTKRLDVEVRLPDTIGERAASGWHKVQDYVFPHGAGFRLGAAYEARLTFNVSEIPERLALALDPLEQPIILVNGIPTGPARTGMVWDPQNQIYDLKTAVRPGNNEIIVTARIPEWAAQHTPVFGVLTGTFGVDRDDGSLIDMPFTQLVPGDWARQGYPDYSGEAIYERVVDIAEADAGRSVYLTVGQCRDIVELWCNGDKVGTRLWNPHRFDLTGRLKPGANRIELKLFNTPANLMERTVESGLTATVALQYPM
ncbi:hypothetical protein ACFSR7_11935 [Cohnella sp. GCM10020058]|uniref:hypothetical protein n=1 Tax=Cohnella sp. GCM10020058 TaxID=3317330 RepID=UPI0036448F20